MDVEDFDELMRAIQLGDMTVIGNWPGKIMKALAVIADTAHPAYDKFPGAPKGGSKEACLFTSLAIRDFFVAIGHTDATAHGCACYIRATGLDGKDVWSVGIGKPNEFSKEGKFNGHAVCTVPSLKLMIDATLYPAIRPQWNGAISGMIAVPYGPPMTDQSFFDRYPFAGAEVYAEGRRVNIIWTDRPELRWKRSIDFERTPRRRAVTRALIEQFGDWRDA